MVVRRFRDNIAEQNWFAVVLDLTIVVVGVFLGIQAANWNQERIDRADAAEHRVQLIENLRANEADIAARIAYYRQVRAHAVAALEALDRRDGKLGEQFLIDAYQASQGWFRPLQRTAYEELVASGVRDEIGDMRIRRQIASYYVVATGFDSNTLGVTAYRDRLRRAMKLPIQLAIRSKCDDIMLRLPQEGQAPSLPATCTLGLDPQLAGRAARELSEVAEIDQDLTRVVIEIDQRLGVYSRALRDAGRLRARLEAASA